MNTDRPKIDYDKVPQEIKDIVKKAQETGDFTEVHRMLELYMARMEGHIEALIEKNPKVADIVKETGGPKRLQVGWDETIEDE